jgi:glutamyl-tRNA synthetase
LQSLASLAEHFDTAHLGKSPARFDTVQLDVWQKEAVHRLDPERASAWLRPYLPAELAPDVERAFVAAIQQNLILPQEAAVWAQVVFGDAAPTSLADPAGESVAAIRAAGRDFFIAASAVVREQGADWKTLTGALKERTGRKGPDLFKPLRHALTGSAHGPELAPLLLLMGGARVIARLEHAATLA